MKIYKRNFQLLEIMIAFFIVLICAVPLIQTYVGLHLEQKQQNNIVDANQLAEEAHAKVLEDIYRQRISLQQFDEPQEKEIEDPNIVEKAKRLNYRITYQLQRLRPPKKEKTPEKILGSIDIKLTKLDNPEKSITIPYHVYAKVQK